MTTRATVPVLFVALALVLLLATRLTAVDFVRDLALDVIGPVEDLTSGATRGRVATVDQLVAENQRLKAENERLLRDAARAPELDREIEQLRGLLGMKQAGASWQWLGARVVGFDSSNLARSAIINRGTRDGLAEGMTVMTPKGLVGKIVHLGGSASRVLLINDPSSTVNALDQRSRARGVVYGQRGAAGAGALAMRYVAQGEELKAGDAVITSGLGGIFPEGVPIGRIAEVRQRDTDMFQEATIEPYVAFDRLEDLYVIVNHVPVSLD